MAENRTLLDRLTTLAYNLAWTWEPEIRDVFRQVDPDRWEKVNHNPVAFLEGMSAEELDAKAGESNLNTRILYADRRMEEYTQDSGLLGGLKAGTLRAAPVAYFSAEFGLHECLPIYSGGLGILAGDHLKAASDTGIPLVAVGLLYAQGYFHQSVDAKGWQQERYEASQPGRMPIQPALAPSGKAVEFKLDIADRVVMVKVWLVNVGRVRLFLMDTNHPANSKEDCLLTDKLYGGDNEKRIQQEIILGIGGLRALRELGIRPGVMHLNEGHCSFAVLERARERMEEDGQSFHDAINETAYQTAFTTHTPVPAGHDRFSAEIIEKYLGWLREKLGLNLKGFLALGRVNAEDDSETFCMTVLALKCSTHRNGVANLHGKVSREMWQNLWPGRELNEIPIGHITNGVHMSSWMAPAIQRLYEKELGSQWQEYLEEEEARTEISNIKDGELWETHMLLKQNLVHEVRSRTVRSAKARGETPLNAQSILDPHYLTIGFSRRFATYKRATLLLEQPDRLRKLVLDTKRPIQFIFAGKAHPKDEGGKKLIKAIQELSDDKDFQGRLIFVEDYDIGIARMLVQGVDVWLNNPERPLEACGTSGMKVAMNGGLNCSILDGWWAEACDGRNGFAIGDGLVHADSQVQRGRDAEALYKILEQELLPIFYARDDDGIPREWVKRMKWAMESLTWRFSARRMVTDYMMKSYLPAAGATSSEMI